MSTTTQVCDQTGATYRQLDHWCRRGYLHPDGEGLGQGRPRTWPPEEVRVVAVMVRLVAAGISPTVAAEVARGRPDIAPGVRIEVTV